MSNLTDNSCFAEKWTSVDGDKSHCEMCDKTFDLTDEQQVKETCKYINL